jgi:putative tryptophan/tyrosine transport system substrate-binding protein
MQFDQLKRREFITLLGGAAAWPLAARAQQPEQARRIGVLMGTADSDPDQKALVSVFTEALAELGWKEGTKIHIEYRWAAGDIARLRASAAELARLALDAIFVQGTPATTALRQAAPTTPLIFVNVTDPVSSGLVSSLAHPGGNITGFTNYEFSMGGKWLEILREIALGITRVAVVFNPDNPVMPGQVRSIEAAGPTLGIQVAARPARNAEEFERAISASASDANGGLLVLLDFVTRAHRELIIGLAARYRLPTGYSLRVFATSGGLFSYGVDPIDLFRRGASYVDRILKGAKPADLPVQQPNKFELVINLKAAKALGLTVPETLLARADEVIE